MKNYRLVIREADRSLFNEVADGKKTIETRAATKKFRAISVGDTLTFACGKDTLVKKVTNVRHFGSLDEMFEYLPLSRIMPSVKTREESRRIYYSFPGYEEKIRAEGILAFDLDA